MDFKMAEGSRQPVGTTLDEPIPVIPRAPNKSHLVGAVKEITFGSMAGIVGKIVEYPFDTIKVRLQSQPDHLPLQYNGPLDCFRQGMRQDGLRGLYRGVSAPLAGAAAENACLFWSYSLAQDLLRATVFAGRLEEQLPMSGLLTAGAMSGAVTSLILTPIELIKCRLQVPLQSPIGSTLSPRIGVTAKTTSPLAVVAEVFRREGLRGFWRGQLGTFFRESGGTAAWFGSFEYTCSYFRRRMALQGRPSKELAVYQQLTAGAVAGISYNFLFYPADTIKSKIQTGELTHVRHTFWSVGKELWRAHGLRGLYRGCGITVARSAPSSALIFTIVERLKTAFP